MSEVHGVGRIEFGDYRIPQWMWRRTTVCVDTGCWEYERTKSKQKGMLSVVVRAVLGVDWSEVFGAIQTCANGQCINPAHLCVTLKRVDTD